MRITNTRKVKTVRITNTRKVKNGEEREEKEQKEQHPTVKRVMKGGLYTPGTWEAYTPRVPGRLTHPGYLSGYTNPGT